MMKSPSFLRRQKIFILIQCASLCLYFGVFTHEVAWAEGQEQQVFEITPSGSATTSMYKVVTGSGKLKPGIYVRPTTKNNDDGWQLAIEGKVFTPDTGPYIVPLKLNHSLLLAQLTVVNGRLFIISRQSRQSDSQSAIEIGSPVHPLVDPLTGDHVSLPSLGNVSDEDGTLMLNNNITVYQKKIRLSETRITQVVIVSVAAPRISVRQGKESDLTFAFLIQQDNDKKELQFASQIFVLNHTFLDDDDKLEKLFSANGDSIGVVADSIKRMASLRMMPDSLRTPPYKHVVDAALVNYFDSMAPNLDLLTGKVIPPQISTAPEKVGDFYVQQVFYLHPGATEASGNIKIGKRGNFPSGLGGLTQIPEKNALVTEISGVAAPMGTPGSFNLAIVRKNDGLDSELIAPFQVVESLLTIKDDGRMVLVLPAEAKNPIKLGLVNETWKNNHTVTQFNYIITKQTASSGAETKSANEIFYFIFSYALQSPDGKKTDRTEIIKFSLYSIDPQNKDQLVPQVHLRRLLMLNYIPSSELPLRFYRDGLLAFDAATLTLSDDGKEVSYRSLLAQTVRDNLPIPKVNLTGLTQTDPFPYVYSTSLGPWAAAETPLGKLFVHRTLPTVDIPALNPHYPNGTERVNHSGIWKNNKLVEPGQLVEVKSTGVDKDTPGKYVLEPRNPSHSNHEMRYFLLSTADSLSQDGPRQLVNRLIISIPAKSAEERSILQISKFPHPLDAGKIRAVRPLSLDNGNKQTNLYIVLEYLDPDKMTQPEYLVVSLPNLESHLGASNQLQAEGEGRILHSFAKSSTVQSSNPKKYQLEPSILASGGGSDGNDLHVIQDSGKFYLVLGSLGAGYVRSLPPVLSLDLGEILNGDEKGYPSVFQRAQLRDTKEHPWIFTDTTTRSAESLEKQGGIPTKSTEIPPFFIEIMQPILLAIENMKNPSGEDRQKAALNSNAMLVVPENMMEIAIRTIVEALTSNKNGPPIQKIIIPRTNDLLHPNYFLEELVKLAEQHPGLVMVANLETLTTPSTSGNLFRGGNENSSSDATSSLRQGLFRLLDIQLESPSKEKTRLTPLEVLMNEREKNPDVAAIPLLIVANRPYSGDDRILANLLKDIPLFEVSQITEAHIVGLLHELLEMHKKNKPFRFLIPPTSTDSLDYDVIGNEESLSVIALDLLKEAQTAEKTSSAFPSREANIAYNYIAQFIQRFTDLLSANTDGDIHWSAIDGIMDDIFKITRPLNVNSLPEKHPYRIAARSLESFYQLLVENGFWGTREQAEKIYRTFELARMGSGKPNTTGDKSENDGIPGILLILGDPGSGKSTSLWATLKALGIADPEKNFMTHVERSPMHPDPPTGQETPVFFYEMSKLSTHSERSEDEMFFQFKLHVEKWVASLKDGLGILMLDEITQPKNRDRLIIFLKGIIDAGGVNYNGKFYPASRLVILLAGNTSGKSDENPGDLRKMLTNLYADEKGNNQSVIDAFFSRLMSKILFWLPAYSSASIHQLAKTLLTLQESSLASESIWPIISPHVFLHLSRFLGNQTIDSRMLDQALRKAFQSLLRDMHSRTPYMIGWKHSHKTDDIEIAPDKLNVDQLFTFLNDHLKIQAIGTKAEVGNDPADSTDRQEALAYVDLSRFQMETVRHQLFESLFQSLDQRTRGEDKKVVRELRQEIMRAISTHVSYQPLINALDISPHTQIITERLGRWQGPIGKARIVRQLSQIVASNIENKDVKVDEYLPRLNIDDKSIPRLTTDLLGNTEQDVAWRTEEFKKKIADLLHQLVSYDQLIQGNSRVTTDDTAHFNAVDPILQKYLDSREVVFSQIAEAVFSYVLESVKIFNERSTDPAASIQPSDQLDRYQPFGAATEIALSLIEQQLVRLPWLYWTDHVVTMIRRVCNFNRGYKLLRDQLLPFLSPMSPGQVDLTPVRAAYPNADHAQLWRLIEQTQATERPKQCDAFLRLGSRAAVD